MKNTVLTRRESQIAERIAWGSSQKEVANDLNISRYTVDNIIRNIKMKLHISKINELSAWWFCTRFNISFDLSPLSRQLLASGLLLLYLGGEIVIVASNSFSLNRSRRVRTECRAKRHETSSVTLI